MWIVIGWLAHVDEYCHVERHRSWTGIKLASPMRRRRARPGCPGGARPPSRRTLSSGGTRSPSHRQELAPGARTAGPRGSRDRGDGRPGAGHGRAATPTGPESRTGVSRPDAPTRLAVRVRRERTPRLAPGRPGYATQKGHTTEGAGGKGRGRPTNRAAALEANPPRHSVGSGHDPAPAPALRRGTSNARPRARLSESGPRLLSHRGTRRNPSGELATSRMERGGAGGAWWEQVHTSGLDQERH